MLPNAQNALVNDVVKSQIENDKDGSRHVCVDDTHASPQLFSIMLKWEFYSVAAEEIMSHSNAEDNMPQARQLHEQNHIPIPFERDTVNINLIKAPTCMACSL